MAESRIVCTAGSLVHAYCDLIGQPHTLGCGSIPSDIFQSPEFQSWAFADPLRHQERVRGEDLKLWTGAGGDEVLPIRLVYEHLHAWGPRHLPFVLLICGDREEPVRVDPKYRIAHGRGRLSRT